MTGRKTMFETAKKITNKILAPRVDYDPLVKVLISRDALLHNLKAFQDKYPQLQFAPVLKSNAYGHGLVEVAEILDSEDLPFFVVDSFFEAYVLRRARVKTDILILGYTRTDMIVRKTLRNVVFTIISLDTLMEVVGKLRAPQRFHIKIDTGMHRQGILPDQIAKAAEIISHNKNFVLEGVCTHFADADSPSPDFTTGQVKKWNEIAKFFSDKFPKIAYFHASNTAGTALAEKLHANVGRLGIGLFGINQTNFERLDLRPALEMRSLVSSIKEIVPGEKVGYSLTFEAIKPMKIAAVPLGYNEGVDLRLSNKGFFQVRGTVCPIVGRVSMNITIIDVSEIRNCRIEDEVVVVSSKRADKNSV
ncbi:MAG: alanine racemase, partial [bacterium]|nr:alanine racemase [bacterium]